MLRALWFFAQLAIVACAVIVIATQKGSVDLVWNNYSFSLTLGLFLLFLVFFVLAVVVFFRFIGGLINLPANFSRRRMEKNRQKGFQALTRGFVAIAAGDTKKANALAKDARHLLPDETGLPLLLEAQAARLRGDEGAANQIFERLLSDKDAAFFGIRGLVKSSLEAGDPAKALTYAKTALEQNPRQPWILKSVYDLEIQSQKWEDAYRTLQKLNKHKVVDLSQSIKDEVALLSILAEEDLSNGNQDGWISKIEKAYKLNPYFVPTVFKLGDHYTAKGKSGKVQSMIEKAWKINPHPALAGLWDNISPMPKASDPLKRLRWFEKLLHLNENSVDGLLAAARVAKESGLNGQAKDYLTRAEKIRPSAQIYRLFATLEEQTSHHAPSVQRWLEKAADAPADPVWYCKQTGYIYESWSGVALPHGAFNTIEWGHPAQGITRAPQTIANDWYDPLLIEQA